MSASGLAEERERRTRLGAACDRPSRGKVGGQPVDGEDEALRHVDGSGAAIEVERDIVNERGAGRDDHRADRKSGEHLHQGEAIASGHIASSHIASSHIASSHGR